MEGMLTGFGVMLALFLIIFGIYFFVAFILAYVFGALGTYRILEKRNIPNAFLAWIPIANMWALGSVYDDIKKKENGQSDPKFRIIMLVVNLAPTISTRLINSSPIYTSQGSIRFSLDLGSTIPLALLIASIVLYLICLKKIFDVYAPNKGSYFTLSILFTTIFALIAPFIPGLLLYKASKNDTESEQQIQNNR